MTNILKEQSLFFEYIENSVIQNNKLSHAYLIETNGYQDYQLVLKEFIKTILTLDINDKNVLTKICYQIDHDEYPDLKYIEPDGLYIRKEQLLGLEREYVKTSMLNNKLVYVIDSADKLNDSSANTILKFLEEPPENIIAILVVEHKYNVLETILSRCQRISLINTLKKEFTQEIIEFCEEIDYPKKLLIKYDYYLEKLFSDKNEAQQNLRKIEEYLFQKIKRQLEKSKIEKISHQVELIEAEIGVLKYNVNLKVWLSSFIFKMMEV